MHIGEASCSSGPTVLGVTVQQTTRLDLVLYIVTVQMLPVDADKQIQEWSQKREKQKKISVIFFRKNHLTEYYNNIFCTEICTYINRDYMYFVIMGYDYVMHFIPCKDTLGIR